MQELIKRVEERIKLNIENAMLVTFDIEIMNNELNWVLSLFTTYQKKQEEKINLGLMKPFHNIDGGTSYISDKIREEISNNILEEFSKEQTK